MVVVLVVGIHLSGCRWAASVGAGGFGDEVPGILQRYVYVYWWGLFFFLFILFYLFFFFLPSLLLFLDYRHHCFYFLNISRLMTGADSLVVDPIVCNSVTEDLINRRVGAELTGTSQPEGQMM